MEEVIRVFIADASRDYVALLCAALEQEKDFSVVGTAYSGDQAAVDFPDSHADLLVTDLLLPGLDGTSLLRRLREKGQLTHAIVVSGFFNDRIARTISCLADNYLPKPCRIQELIGYMRESVRGGGKIFVRDFENTVTDLLITCGVQPHLDGFLYLRDALLRILDDHSLLRGVTKSLYRDIGKRFNTNAACVERSIRAAIVHAWKRKSCAERSRCFGALFDAYEEPPSNVPFLTAMTEFIETQYQEDRQICR